MKRRTFNRVAGLSAISLFASHVSGADRGRKDKRPNILFIMTDQQSARMMSCAGNKDLRTPAMDGLAASGVRFEHAYACNPVCIPSRFSLQTGLMPSAIGMGANGDSQSAQVKKSMIDNSLAKIFQQAGYETVYGGKVHLPDGMDGLRGMGYRNLTSDQRQELADVCAGFIRQKHDKPFLLFASFINPHDICYMAINDHARSKGKNPQLNVAAKTCEKLLDEARNSADLKKFVEDHCPELPSNYEIPEQEPECITTKYSSERSFREYARSKWSNNQWRLHRWAYCRLTEMVDTKIGIVLQALKDSGLEENTLVVFTSDHGDMDSAHRLEHKSVLYEEAVRIPFIMSYKGIIPAGVTDSTHLVSNGLDLLPTLCDYAGIKPPEGLSGCSLRAAAEGGAKEPHREYVVAESKHGRMVFSGRHKYVIYDSGKYREQFIDLQNDPGEMKNLTDDPQYKTELARHRRYLKEWVERTGDKIAAGYIV